MSIFANPVNLQNMSTLGVGQFPSRTSNNFFLESIFPSSMSASIKKKVSQNQTKLQQTKQTNKQTKINKVLLSPILQNLKGRSVLEKKNWKWSSRRAEKDATKQIVIYFQEVSQKRKMVVKIEFTPLSPGCKMFTFKNPLKNVKFNFK